MLISGPITLIANCVRRTGLMHVRVYTQSVKHYWDKWRNRYLSVRFIWDLSLSKHFVRLFTLMKHLWMFYSFGTRWLSIMKPSHFGTFKIYIYTTENIFFFWTLCLNLFVIKPLGSGHLYNGRISQFATLSAWKSWNVKYEYLLKSII